MAAMKLLYRTQSQKMPGQTPLLRFVVDLLYGWTNKPRMSIAKSEETNIMQYVWSL